MGCHSVSKADKVADKPFRSDGSVQPSDVRGSCVQFLLTTNFLLPFSKRSESRRGYASTIKMLAAKFS